MDAAFWTARWSENQIGFHEGRPNAFLERHAGRLGERRHVLVPLCGKSEDLAFLAARGHTVTGVELVEDAVRAFFDEHHVVPTVQRGTHATYTAGAITILAGDFFAVTPALAGPINAIYDRAALVALPPETRPRYADHVRMLVPVGSPGLVVTFEYPQDRMSGPPFAVFESELRALYAGQAIELVDERPAENARAREAGIVATERCFAIAF
jgi:thiopurine S-methyltransferase